MGLFDVLDILNHFGVITGVFTLDVSCLQTYDLEKMRHVATKSEYGFNLKAPSAAINLIVQLITNPGSPEEAYTINTALKTLDLKKNGNTIKFYELMGEAMSRRLIFTKLSQIYTHLIEELKANKELLIMLINNKLIELSHLEELMGDEIKIAHYIIHNVNTYRKLKKFTKICQSCCRDTNLIELIFEINFEIDCYQMSRLSDVINDDMKKRACFIY